MSVFSERKKLIVPKKRTINPKNLMDFTDKSPKNSENLQNESENLQNESENVQKIQSEIDEKPVRPAFLNNLPRLSVPRIYVQRPVMRRVVFLSLFLFMFPLIVSLVLALALILGCYWLLKVFIG